MKIREKLIEYKRVLKVAKKPTKEEFMYISKICVIGMSVVGIIGFILYVFSIVFIG